MCWPTTLLWLKPGLLKACYLQPWAPWNILFFIHESLYPLGFQWAPVVIHIVLYSSLSLEKRCNSNMKFWKAPVCRSADLLIEYMIFVAAHCGLCYWVFTTKSCMSSLCGSGSCRMSSVELQQYRFKQSKRSSGMDQRAEAGRLGPIGGRPAVGDRPGFDLSV